MQFYSVRLQRKKLISRFEGKTKIEIEEKIEETYHDLPLVTAERYRTLFPEAVIEIVPQAVATGKPPAISVRGQTTRRQPEAAKLRGKSAPKPVEAKDVEWGEPKRGAAGTYEELVNKLATAEAA